MLPILSKLHKLLISEKVMNFNGEIYPKSGWLLNIVGGPASGKSTQLSTSIPISGKLFNIDDISDIYSNEKFYNKIKQNMIDQGLKEEVEFMENNLFDNTSPKPKIEKHTDYLHMLAKSPSYTILKKTWNDMDDENKKYVRENFFDNKEPNFLELFEEKYKGNGIKYDRFTGFLNSHPDKYSQLLKYFKATYERLQDAFYNNVKKIPEKNILKMIKYMKKNDILKNIDNPLRSILPNIIIDATGRDLDRLKKSINDGHDLGYKTSIVWVITHLEKAKKRNEDRERTVPNLENMYNSVYDNMISILTGNDTISLLDEFWLIFDSKSEETTYKPNMVIPNDKLKKSELVIDTYTRNSDKVKRINKTSNGFFIVDKKILDMINSELGK